MERCGDSTLLARIPWTTKEMTEQKMIVFRT
jgi:hypothetical protein